MKLVVCPNSHWASNVGNGFFNLGVMHLLQSAHPRIAVAPTDNIASRGFGFHASVRRNAVRLAEHLDAASALVLSGPLFDRHFGRCYEGVLRNARDRGIPVCCLSAGGVGYQKDEVEHVQAVLRAYPPRLLVSRDAETHALYGRYASRAYPGLCGAWFVPEAVRVFDTPGLEPYCTVCFDNGPEPRLAWRAGGEHEPADPARLGEALAWRRPAWRVGASARAARLARLAQRGLVRQLGPYRVIRPTHNVIGRSAWRLFFRPNSFASQTPYGYLQLYARTAFTLTDRLHAAVATMAFGQPARLLLDSPRCRLLDRVGAGASLERLHRPDPAVLEAEKRAMRHWLTEALHELLGLAGDGRAR